MTVLSQSTLTLNNKIDVYRGLVAGDECRKNQLPECQKVVEDLFSIIEDQSKAIITAEAQDEKQKSELESNYKKHEQQAVADERAKQKAKRFSLGPGFIFDYRGNPTVGIGISYTIWRF